MLRRNADSQELVRGRQRFPMRYALVASSLCPRREKHTMGEVEVQIVDSGLFEDML
jgi:hypothetical protein